MSCNADYLEATNKEVEASKVLALIEEIKTNTLPDYYGDGYFKKVYGKNVSKILKDKVPILCSYLQNEKDVSKYSLEMQMWWRDHKKADAKRLEKQILKEKDKKIKDKILSKLTPYEREVLGLL